MSRELRFALIGCGALGRVHCNCIARIDGARMTAFCDVHEPSAQALCHEFGGEYATADVHRILSDEHIDAVYICTRHDSHAPLAIQAARAGKHILIEKPLALSGQECENISAAVTQSGVYLMPAFKLRYYPLIRKAREFIPTPQVIVGQLMDERWADDHWAQDPVIGGANVYSQGCHMTDIIRYLAGSEPQTISAVGGTLTHPGSPRLDHCVASIQFRNGHVASWINGDAATAPYVSKFFVELFGDGKSVQLYDRFKKATFADGARSWTEERDEEEGFLLENQEFVKALREGREPEISAFDGLQATRMVTLADRAIQTGEVQHFDAASP